MFKSIVKGYYASIDNARLRSMVEPHVRGLRPDLMCLALLGEPVVEEAHLLDDLIKPRTDGEDQRYSSHVLLGIIEVIALEVTSAFYAPVNSQVMCQFLGYCDRARSPEANMDDTPASTYNRNLIRSTRNPDSQTNFIRPPHSVVFVEKPSMTL
ncbi:MAG: hypothetical protein AAGF11_12635 [Myxococcota bacterium]